MSYTKEEHEAEARFIANNICEENASPTLWAVKERARRAAIAECVAALQSVRGHLTIGDAIKLLEKMT